MRRFILPLLIASLGLVCVRPVSADDKSSILDQKNELEKIKRDVEQGQKKLDSLKNIQLNVQKQINEADQKMSSDQKVIGRLNRQLDGLKKDVAQAESDLADRRESFDRTQRRYLGNIRQFYYTVEKKDNLLSDSPNLELQRNRAVVYLTALASFESGNVEQASVYLAQAVEQLDDLSGQSREVSSLKRKKEVSYSLDRSRKSKQEKQLDQLRRKTMAERERIMTLQMAAEEMERIIARLEEERQRSTVASRGDHAASVFAGLKGQLRSPFRGKVIVPFGNLQDPVTKLKSFSPGITIKGRPRADVTLVASGTVAYAGNLRGYGNFVIINHDNQYYTTYAGLGEVVVTEGQHLTTGAKLASAGDDGIVKFELRKGHEPLDPVTWIRIESF